MNIMVKLPQISLVSLEIQLLFNGTLHRATERNTHHKRDK